MDAALPRPRRVVRGGGLESSVRESGGLGPLVAGRKSAAGAGYFPVKAALRFSTNAPMPSFWSAVEKLRPKASAS